MLEDLFVAIEALNPEVEACKRGTLHEGHSGWGTAPEESPYRWQCSCGGSLDGLLGLPPVRVFEMAHCAACAMPPLPFEDAGERDTWATAHVAGTGHRVTRYPVKR